METTNLLLIQNQVREFHCGRFFRDLAIGEPRYLHHHFNLDDPEPDMLKHILAAIFQEECRVLTKAQFRGRYLILVFEPSFVILVDAGKRPLTVSSLGGDLQLSGPSDNLHFNGDFGLEIFLSELQLNGFFVQHESPHAYRDEAATAIMLAYSRQDARSLASVLLDRRLLAGVSIEVVADTCALAGVLPQTPLTSLASHEVARVIETLASETTRRMQGDRDTLIYGRKHATDGRLIRYARCFGSGRRIAFVEGQDTSPLVRQ